MFFPPKSAGIAVQHIELRATRIELKSCEPLAAPRRRPMPLPRGKVTRFRACADSIFKQRCLRIQHRDLAARRARVLQNCFASPKIEGAGNAGRSMRPQPRVRNKKAHERSHHGHTGNHPAFPAQWFYGLLRALPGDQACLTPSPALLIADLTPALGRQNDTTWPYASRPRSSRALPRPPHPAPRP
jgi:hypothetical protein